MHYQTKPTIRASEIRSLYLAECSAVTFWRLRVSDETFPQSFKLGGTNFWDRQEVQIWYENIKSTQTDRTECSRRPDLIHKTRQTQNGGQDA